MLSQIPFKLEKIKKEDLEKEIARVGMIAELDAINLYEQLAAVCEDEKSLAGYSKRRENSSRRVSSLAFRKR